MIRPRGLVRVKILYNMQNFICITNDGRQPRINHIFEYGEISEGLRTKHSGEVRVHIFSDAQIVCMSSVIFFECDEIVSSFSNGINITPKRLRVPIYLQILGNVLNMLPPSRIASFLQGVIQGTILSPVVYSPAFL